MECKTPEVFMVTYQFTFVEEKKKQQFCFRQVRVDIFSVLAATGYQPFVCKMKVGRGVRHNPPHSDLFLGLLGDHVAWGCHWTTAIWLLLLSWF